MKFFSHKQDTALILSAISILIAVAALVYAARVSSRTTVVDQHTYTDVQSRPLTADNPAAALPHASQAGGLDGPIAAMTADRITVGSGAQARSARITASTKIFQQGAQKSAEQYDKEIAAFQKTLAYAAGTQEVFFAPEPFVTTPLTLADLQPNDMVSIRTDGALEPTAVMIYRVTREP